MRNILYNNRKIVSVHESERGLLLEWVSWTRNVWRALVDEFVDVLFSKIQQFGRFLPCQLVLHSKLLYNILYIIMLVYFQRNYLCRVAANVDVQDEDRPSYFTRVKQRHFLVGVFQQLEVLVVLVNWRLVDIFWPLIILSDTLFNCSPI